MSRSEEDLHVNLTYAVIYEDDDYLIVDKPAPLPVHAVGRFPHKNLLTLLKNDFPQYGKELRVVNRIDSETSGLVIIAKNKEAAFLMAKKFEYRQVEKEYDAIVFGKVESEEGKIEDALKKTKSEEGYYVQTLNVDGEEAETSYKTVKRGSDYSWVKVYPKTGRTHQIRVHLKSIGHVLVGDKLYIDYQIFDDYVKNGWQDYMLQKLKANRLLLHASSLRLIHPYLDEEITFKSEVPPLFKEFVS